MADLKFLPADSSHWILSSAVSIDCFLAHIVFLHVLSILGSVHSWMIYIVEPLDFVVFLWRILIFFFLSGQLTNVRLQPVSLEVNSHRHLCLVPVALGGLLAQEIRGQQWFVQSLCTECIARPPLFWLSSFQDFPLTFQFNHLVLFLLALHANKTPGFLSKFWVTPVWQGLGPAFWQKAVIIGNLPVVIPFFQRQTPLQHLPAWLLFAAFGI